MLLGAHPLGSLVLETEALVFLRPDADGAIGAWTTDTGATTGLFAALDEEISNDADYIKSSQNPTTDVCRISLSPPGASVNTAAAPHIRYRYKKDIATNQVDLVVRLIEGASTVIATWTHLDIGLGIVQADQVLSGAQVASIGSFGNLSLEFEAQ